MALEYKTLKFPNDKDGPRQKDESITVLAANGWHVGGESIEAGHVKRDKLAALFRFFRRLDFFPGEHQAALL